MTERRTFEHLAAHILEPVREGLSCRSAERPLPFSEYVLNTHGGSALMTRNLPLGNAVNMPRNLRARLLAVDAAIRLPL
jgi:hypothetical protein